ncbi:MAG TPA: hypothetical protein PKG77_15675 [Phycisphaerae bacterium]|nr:hypothetical protein [Phycisphaerae bacterium]
MSRRTEVGIFAVGLGLIWGGAVTIWSVMMSNPTAPPVGGLSRTVFCLALLLPGPTASLACGIWFLVRPSRWGLLACIVAAALVPIGYGALMFAALGTLPMNLMTIVLLAVPVVVIARAPQAFEELAPDKQSAPGAAPDERQQEHFRYPR